MHSNGGERRIYRNGYRTTVNSGTRLYFEVIYERKINITSSAFFISCCTSRSHVLVAMLRVCMLWRYYLVLATIR